MTNISISIDDDLLEWLDQLIERNVINSRSEAVRGAIFDYIRNKLGIADRKALRAFLSSRQKNDFQSSVDVIRSVRREE